MRYLFCTPRALASTRTWQTYPTGPCPLGHDHIGILLGAWNSFRLSNGKMTYIPYNYEGTW